MMMHYHPSPFLGEHLREVAHVPAEDEDVAEEGHHQQLPVVAQHVHRVHPLNPPVQVLLGEVLLDELDVVFPDVVDHGDSQFDEGDEGGAAHEAVEVRVADLRAEDVEGDGRVRLVLEEPLAHEVPRGLQEGLLRVPVRHRPPRLEPHGALARLIQLARLGPLHAQGLARLRERRLRLRLVGLGLAAAPLRRLVQLAVHPVVVPRTQQREPARRGRDGEQQIAGPLRRRARRERVLGLAPLGGGRDLPSLSRARRRDHEHVLRQRLARIGRRLREDQIPRHPRTVLSRSLSQPRQPRPPSHF
mmetsp:Transcript_38472/g.82688  ORF Transcript_38472/g.82688 Transcript_38472/m.82688 type:complete len:302 (+) Transcript_38472:294-1199(+)